MFLFAFAQLKIRVKQIFQLAMKNNIVKKFKEHSTEPEDGMDWINPLDSKSSLVQADLDWTGSEIH